MGTIFREGEQTDPNNRGTLVTFDDVLPAYFSALRIPTLSGRDLTDFDRENTSVILGAGGGLGDLGTQYAVRSEIPRFVENPDESVWERLPEWSEESFAGSLLNVALRLGFRETQWLEPDRAAWLFAFDIAQLAVLLYLTGGLDNRQ